MTTTRFIELDTWKLKIEEFDTAEVCADFVYRNTNVIVENGKVFVNAALLGVLGFRSVRWSGLTPRISWGREKFYSFEQAFDEIMGYATYERRNEREAAVAARNLKITEILMGL